MPGPTDPKTSEEAEGPASAEVSAHDGTPGSTISPDDLNHFTQSDAIEVRRVLNRGKGGRAVIARRAICEGETFERVPVLLIPDAQVFGTDPAAQKAIRISWYVFKWLPTKRGYVALSLGYGSIYNHSEQANAAYQMEMPDVMTFYALRSIAAGEEILINYAGNDGPRNDLGFTADDEPLRPTDDAL